MQEYGAWFYELQFRKKEVDWSARLVFQRDTGISLKDTIDKLNLTVFNCFEYTEFKQYWYICSDHYDALLGNIRGKEANKLTYYNYIVVENDTIRFERSYGGHSQPQYRDAEMAIFEALLKEEKLKLLDWAIEYGFEGVYSAIKTGKTKQQLQDYLTYLSTLY